MIKLIYKLNTETRNSACQMKQIDHSKENEEKWTGACLAFMQEISEMSMNLFIYGENRENTLIPHVSWLL